MPRLLSALAADGSKVNEIRTRVQPAVTSYPGDGRAEPSSDASSLHWPPNDERAVAAVVKLVDSVTDSPLKDAARRLAATLQKRADRS